MTSLYLFQSARLRIFSFESANSGYPPTCEICKFFPPHISRRAQRRAQEHAHNSRALCATLSADAARTTRGGGGGRGKSESRARRRLSFMRL